MLLNEGKAREAKTLKPTPPQYKSTRQNPLGLDIKHKTQDTRHVSRIRPKICSFVKVYNSQGLLTIA
jgi:hypothetical protein